MGSNRLHGYSDFPSAAPGETLRFFVSSGTPGRYRADVVRLVHGDTNPAGPGFQEVVVETDVSGEYPARFQPIRPGSCVIVEDADGRLHPAGALSLHAFVLATTPAKGRQGIVTRWNEETRSGWALGIDEGARFVFTIGDGTNVCEVSAGKAILPSIWYSLAAGFDPGTGRVWVSQTPIVTSVNGLLGPVCPIDGESLVETDAPLAPADAGVAVILAGRVESKDERGRPVIGAHFNGKLDRPRCHARRLGAEEIAGLAAGREPATQDLLVRWDFAAAIGPGGIEEDSVADTSGSDLHGRCVNLPTRAVTGWNWSGREECFRHAPGEYGAIHFHDDDLEDAGWEADFELTVPQDLKSDVYAARLRHGDSEEHVPFFVLPPRGRPTAKILFLVPTASYLAYANDRIVAEVPVAQAIVGHTPVLDDAAIDLVTHPELGLSTYDHHSDGSGVCHSSWRRPILTMRPKFRHGTGSVWQFPADLHLVHWLNAKGYRYDVATDHDLDREGPELLRRYRVVLTGTHPEYVSSRMLDAFEAYLARGGRAMYLGANGFYWVTTFHPRKPWVIEVRKGESGTRAWQASPGELYHATGGERGGLWRNRGRPPQKIFGVGFAAEGFDRSSYYVRMPDALDAHASWILEGVRHPERIGDFGLVGGGAAGYEIDRYDLALGTPPHAKLLASSEGLSDDTLHAVEEIFFNFPGLGGTEDPQVRADLVYFTTPGGGAVFSTGSIAWCGSLGHEGGDNDVSRITANVLSRFEREEPLS